MRVMHLRHRLTQGRICLQLPLVDAIADLLETYLQHPRISIVISTDRVQLDHAEWGLGDLGEYEPSSPNDEDYRAFLQFANHLQQVAQQRATNHQPQPATTVLTCVPRKAQDAPPTWHEAARAAIERLCGNDRQMLQSLRGDETNVIVTIATTIGYGLVPATSGCESR